MTFEEWWVDRHGINWKAYYTDSAKEAAEEAWEAATLAERESCAKVCEDHAEDAWDHEGGSLWCADAIRARSK